MDILKVCLLTIKQVLLFLNCNAVSLATKSMREEIAPTGDSVDSLEDESCSFSID